MQNFTQQGIPMSTEVDSIFCQQTTDIKPTYSFDSFLHSAYDLLSAVKTFAWKGDRKASPPLCPFFVEVFSAEETSQLTQFYKYMYPDRDLPVSCHKFGYLVLAGDLVGSGMPGPSSILSAVIMAYWGST